MRDLIIYSPQIVLKLTDPGVDVVDNKTTQLPRLSHRSRGGQIPSPQHRPGLPRRRILQLPRARYDRLQSHFLTRQLHVHRFAATLVSPTPQN